MFPCCCLPLHITVVYIFMLLNCMALFHITLVEAEVIVRQRKTNLTLERYDDMPAHFGNPLPTDGLKGYVVYSSPPNACIPIQSPPRLENYTGNWIVLIRRYGCSFEDKVRHAQDARFKAAIVHNVHSDVLEPMGADTDNDIYIPSLFIGDDAGEAIREYYQYNSGYYVVLTDDFPVDLSRYLLPFAIVVGICFVVMLLFMIVKCIQDRRRQRRHRLPTSSLKKIPTTKFKKGDPYDTCAICLEDYLDGDKLRVLPCSHAYHTRCIDPWLTRNRRVCPVCKRKVFAQDEQLSDSESETEDENSPLIQSGNYGTQGGTFVPQRVNPIMAARQHMQDAAAAVEPEEALQATAAAADSRREGRVVSSSVTDNLTSGNTAKSETHVQSPAVNQQSSANRGAQVDDQEELPGNPEVAFSSSSGVMEHSLTGRSGMKMESPCDTPVNRKHGGNRKHSTNQLVDNPRSEAPPLEVRVQPPALKTPVTVAVNAEAVDASDRKAGMGETGRRAAPWRGEEEEPSRGGRPEHCAEESGKRVRARMSHEEEPDRRGREGQNDEEEPSRRGRARSEEEEPSRRGRSQRNDVVV